MVNRLESFIKRESPQVLNSGATPDNDMAQLVVLYGPRSVGKSTIGKELSDLTNFQYVDFDAVCDAQLRREGYEGIKGFIDQGIGKYGAQDTHLAWRDYGLWQRGVLDGLLQVHENTDTILDVGGGTLNESLQDEQVNIHKLNKYGAVKINILPDQDPEKAVQTLYSREKKRGHWTQKARDDPHWDNQRLLKKTYDDYMERLEEDKSMADHQVYVNERTAKEVAEEIKNLI